MYALLVCAGDSVSKHNGKRCQKDGATWVLVVGGGWLQADVSATSCNVTMGG